MCIVTAACFGIFIGHLQVIKVKGKVLPGRGHEGPGGSRGIALCNITCELVFYVRYYLMIAYIQDRNM